MPWAFHADFNPPAPCGAGLSTLCAICKNADFNPPAPCGAGPAHRGWPNGSYYFNPPAPCGAGLCDGEVAAASDEFQSTRPLRGGTADPLLGTNGNAISIHPPLAGRDTYLRSIRRACCHFNPPAPCGAGPAFLRDTLSRAHFNPPAPCGAGQERGGRRGERRDFNPPAPCGAGPVPLSSYTPPLLFQSTRPLRGGPAILHKKAVQNIAYCTKSAFTLAVLSGFLALMRPFFCQTCTNFGANLPKNRCSLPVRTLIPSGPPPADSRH